MQRERVNKANQATSSSTAHDINSLEVRDELCERNTNLSLWNTTGGLLKYLCERNTTTGTVSIDKG